MARPKKNNVDYFPHDSNLRNHRKVKAVRNKFGSVLGYAFWCMMLEWLTEHDGLEWEFSDIECEMFASELGVTAAEIRDMVDYCVRLEMLFKTDSGFIYSDSLNDRLSIVFEKRNRERERSKLRERREDGTYKSTILGVTAAETTQNVAETPQSKVKESKVKKTIEERQKAFYESLTPFVEKYGKEVLRKFYDYWTEKDKNGIRMRFEAQKFFDVTKRLNTWYSKEDNFKNKKQVHVTEAIESPFAKRNIHA